MKGKYNGQSIVTYRYFCRERSHYDENGLQDSQGCDGRLIIRIPVGSGSIHVDYSHHATHSPQGKGLTRPSSEAVEYIRNNLQVRPSQLYKNMAWSGLIGAFISRDIK